MGGEHKANLASYLEVDQFSQLLRTLHQLLDFFEAELGREGRTGLWLGGAFLSIADITLGMCLIVSKCLFSIVWCLIVFNGSICLFYQDIWCLVVSSVWGSCS